ncbi:hypothetical protein BJ987_002041 [Nocardia goodfellowii]|uniref:LPXTG cell wall anchor domain-containing protein n=1 Tax=Nocardia goodfellowii TaxID=882446 RepID=A0ABS4QDA0_9NOCA|nr:hypothetical protein [Nocardia goodfellowii]
MELLVIIGIAVLVGVVVLKRKARGQEPHTPESPDNDGQ